MLLNRFLNNKKVFGGFVGSYHHIYAYRNFSFTSGNRINYTTTRNLSHEFIEWFRGFTDAEGCFLIVKTGNTFTFRFIIKLHVDDVNLLNFIRNSLEGIGNVSTEGSVANYKVSSQKEIKLIIEIFTKYSLNSSKHLDFLAFRRAYELYISSNSKTPELAKEINMLKIVWIGRELILSGKNHIKYI